MMKKTMRIKLKKGDAVTMKTRRVCIVLFTVIACYLADCSIVRGPQNVVGIHHDNVTLHCQSDASQKVRWIFTPFGLNAALDESKFPGHYSISSSNYGRHSLTLERVTFQNAGRYECRVVGYSEGGVDAATAFVVVVADPPHCQGNVPDRPTNGQSVQLDCSLTFIGATNNLTMEWLSSTGQVLLRNTYRSGADVPDVARLSLVVKLRSSSSRSDYTCRAYFSNGTTKYDDVASNAPQFRHNHCTTTVPGVVLQNDTSRHTQLAASSASGHNTLAFIVVACAIGMLIFCIFVIVYCQRARIKAALGRSAPNNNGAPADDSEKQPMWKRENEKHERSCDGSDTVATNSPSEVIDTDETVPVADQSLNNAARRPASASGGQQEVYVPDELSTIRTVRVAQQDSGPPEPQAGVVPSTSLSYYSGTTSRSAGTNEQENLRKNSEVDLRHERMNRLVSTAEPLVDGDSTEQSTAGYNDTDLGGDVGGLMTKQASSASSENEEDELS